MPHLVVMQGDGIGPEITAATLHVLRAADQRFGLGLTSEDVTIGFASLRQNGTTISDAAVPDHSPGDSLGGDDGHGGGQDTGTGGGQDTGTGGGQDTGTGGGQDTGTGGGGG